MAKQHKYQLVQQESTPVQQAIVDQVVDYVFSIRKDQTLTQVEYAQLKSASVVLGVHLKEHRLQHNETLYGLRVVVDHLDYSGRQLFVDVRGGGA